MTDFKVTVGVKEIKVTANDRNEAADKAIGQLADNVTWVMVTKVEPLRTGFRPQDDAGQEHG